MVKDVNTEEVLALKRLLVNDHEDLAKVKEEIEFMVCIFIILIVLFVFILIDLFFSLFLENYS